VEIRPHRHDYFEHGFGSPQFSMVQVSYQLPDSVMKAMGPGGVFSGTIWLLSLCAAGSNGGG
jgi:hypothetical protein